MSKLRERRNSRSGNRGGRDQYAGLDDQQRNILKGINSVPNGRKIDNMARDGRYFDPHTRLFLKPRGYQVVEGHQTGLLMSELDGSPE